MGSNDGDGDTVDVNDVVEMKDDFDDDGDDAEEEQEEEEEEFLFRLSLRCALRKARNFRSFLLVFRQCTQMA